MPTEAADRPGEIAASDIWALCYLISHELYFQRYRRSVEPVVPIDVGGITKIVNIAGKLSAIDQRDLLLPRVERLLNWCNKHKGKKEIARNEIEILYHRLDELFSDAKLILEDRSLIPTNHEKFFIDESKVATYDKAAAQDLSEGIRCFSCRRFTATVFNCSRAVETALRRLAKKERVALDPGPKLWQQITDKLNSHVNGLPAKTDRQIKKRKKLSETLAHLNALRIGWRNPVMHPGEFYSEDEAREFVRNTCALLRSLVG